MSILDPLGPYRTAIEVGLGVAVLVAVGFWWHEHDLKQQMIGKQECEQGVTTARQEATKAADDLYARQLKEKDDAIAQYQANKAAADTQHDLDLKQLHDYQNRLRASAVQAPPNAAGNPGPEIVRFTFESFESFTNTCASVAKDGQDDALALKMCKTYVDGLPNAGH